MNRITITNEEQAWDIYEKAVSNRLDELGEFLDIKFDGWPRFEMHISGRDFDASIPTRIMPPILDLQKEIHRTYCLVKYGEESTRRLTKEEREKLEIVVKVNKGSSDFQAKLWDIFNEAVQSGVAKMEPAQIVIILVSAGLMLTATAAWKAWLQYKAQEKQIESQVRLSQVEKEKMELVAKASKTVPEVKIIQQGFDEVRNNSLHRLQPTDRFSIPGTDDEIDGRYASDITHKPREQSQEVRLDGEFVIQSVDSGGVSGYRIKVKRRIDGMILTVRIPDGTLSNDQMDVLKNNEWAKRPVLLDINAKILRNEIRSATLVGAQYIEREELTEES
ncbi:hypothetical protein Q2E61_10365 [Microbulbifer thermotolerans]|uniref:hypothetical protein n=1 Tax=Microbulbifer thermotolerans TaxID=252514 RepID=UPI0026727364|nr:hypothetical protein [Microbulbifer thermotolerans]WKT59318.1 hypothetical protein Q2E61_10365 [Microbulbifer thermotolerans]